MEDCQPTMPAFGESLFPTVRRLLDEEHWQRFSAWTEVAGIPASRETTAAEFQIPGLPTCVFDLARLELARHQVCQAQLLPVSAQGLSLNPTVQLVCVAWLGLPALMAAEAGEVRPPVEAGQEWIVLYQGPKSGRIYVRPASVNELLAIKMVVEGLTVSEVAGLGNIPSRTVHGLLRQAVAAGLLLMPLSTLVRESVIFSRPTLAEYQRAPVFTLQWHLTQACDLHCRHCYDRDPRVNMSFTEGLAVLDDLTEFCKERQAAGQVSFTGGNPLLHPRFFDLYAAAADRGLTTAILGNPTTATMLDTIQSIQPLEFYQVSLEGLEEHNDFIRGKGHFARVLHFLDLLRNRSIYAMVMLTLTEANLDQVLSLAELLRHRVDLFTFNRLSQVGEGVALAPAAPEMYRDFLQSYQQAARDNSIMGVKDNLFNLLRYQAGGVPFGGCAGFGCGAAFNFLALLPDGEVHACRKFPSPLGNIRAKGLAESYDSPLAQSYRRGPSACQSCAIRPVCGGCLAVSHSHGLDIFHDRDPYCFLL